MLPSPSSQSSSLGHLLGDCLQLAAEDVHHHVERVEREPRSEEDHTHLVPKTMNLVFQNIRHRKSGTQICYKKYQVHKRINTLTVINSRFVRRLRANFRAILQRKNQDNNRSKLMHSLTMIYILHTCERRKASPALQQETSIP